MAKTVEKRGNNTIKPKLVIGGAELVDDFTRKVVEKTFHAPFYDQYGCVEFERIASQCWAKQGYHIDSDTVITQFVDMNDDEVSPGEKGVIVCTSLFNYVMPLLRYFVGDVGLPSDEECPCGRTLPLVKGIEGRKDSIIVLPDGRLVSPRVFTSVINMFKQVENITQFRILQNRPNYLVFQLVVKHDAIDKKKMETELLMHVRKMLKLDPNEVELEIRFVDTVSPNGKFMTVISNVNR